MAARPSEPLLALLREVAKKQGLNTAALAARIGCDRAHLKQVLSGREPLTVDELIALAQVLELGPEQLGGVPIGSDTAATEAEGGEPEAPEEAPALGVLPDRGIDAGADPIGAAADPYGNQPAQALRLGLALGCDVHLLLDASLVQDSGVPRHVLAQFKERLPLKLDAAYHKHHDVRFLPDQVRMVLSFDALYTCHFPWAAILQVTLFPLPPELPEPEEVPVEEPESTVRRGHLRLVE